MERIPALAVLSALVVAGLLAAYAPTAAAATDPNVGFDISYPQCNGTFPSGGAFGIAGVNGGRLYSPNPCLGTGDGASELSWAGMNAALYSNTGDPGPALSTHWPNGQTSPQACNTATNPGSDTPQCHYDYGWNAAADSYQDAVNAYVSLGWAQPGATRTPVANRWWLDVESANSWTTTASLNVEALRGEADYLGSVGVAGVGFYASPSNWQSITGGTTAFSAYPSWVPGAGTLADAQSKCGGTGATGGPVALAQYLSGGFDGDYQCVAQPGLSFSGSPQTLTAGTASVPISVQLSQAPSGSIAVTVTSNSTTGLFSTTAQGPWSATLTLTVPAGASSTGTFSYVDTKAGTPSLAATASGYTSASQTETVVAGPVAAVAVSPSTATVQVGGGQVFSAIAADAYGNPIDSSGAAWSTTAPGTVSPTTGSQTTFTAGSTVGSGSVTASVGSVSGSASVSVVASQHMNVVVTKGSTFRSGGRYRVPLTSTATNAGSGAPIAGAGAKLEVASGSCSGPIVAKASGSTDSNGRFGFTFKTKTAGSYCALATVNATGYAPGSGLLSFAV
ncbi:MAG: hypothetical protein ACJ77A_10420 [Actinomycetota bacterium]